MVAHTVASLGIGWHNMGFSKVTGISSHECVPRLHKNNQDHPNCQVEVHYDHEMKADWLLTGLADIFPGGNERISRIFMF